MPELDPKQAALRALPSIDEVLRGEVARGLGAGAPLWAVTEAARAAVQAERRRILEGQTNGGPALPRIEAALPALVHTLTAPSLRRVVNATGVVLHTNLGRAPLSRAVLDRVAELGSHYSNLELDLATGERGSRHQHLAAVLCALTGAEDAIVVNNNAAAVLLVATALGAGREVVVSRGELVEIGGAFRIPDVLAAGGARLREVGTTNRTRLSDYSAAIGPDTAVLMKVHRSNFAVVGFSEEVGIAELAELGRARGVPVVEDLGSGAMTGFARFHEPTAAEAVAAGADLVTISGDKLLGGPQAGIVVGRAALVARLRKHPLMRALRPDKLTLVALEATLALFRDGSAAAAVPVVSMIEAAPEALRLRAETLAARCLALGVPATALSIRASSGKVGGGAQPMVDLPGWAVVLAGGGKGADAMQAALRAADPPVLARVAEDAVWLDVRTLTGDDEIELVARAVASSL